MAGKSLKAKTTLSSERRDELVRIFKMIVMAILQGILNFLKKIFVMFMGLCIILLMLFMRAMVTYSAQAPPIVTIVMSVILGIGAIFVVCAWFFSKPEPASPSITPEDEEIWRARFNPLARPPKDNPEDRIKLDAPPGPNHPTEPHP
jgi:hypothetical protein